jgi:cytochrome c peroxidase
MNEKSIGAISGIVAAAMVATAATAIVMDRSNAEAIVGETRKVDIAPAPDPSIDSLRADYRRPKVIPFPKDNPYTPEKAELGKKLYFDTRLSAAYVLSCASCHNPGYGWGDGLPKGVGHQMKTLGRRSPTIINAAYGLIFMWDGRAGSLEEQALGPIQADVEMALPLDQLLVRLKNIPEYAPLFEAAFPKQGIVADTIAKAIATYERTVVSGSAPFDTWIEGSDKAISEEAKRGFVLFNKKGQCSACHSGWNFTNDSFHDIGLPSEDMGRGKFLVGITKAQQAFKTPGLREITRRAPYMHDGSLLTLEAVIEHYDRGGVARESRSDQIKSLGLTAQEKSDLVAFMKTLTSDVDPTTVPILPR